MRVDQDIFKLAIDFIRHRRYKPIISEVARLYNRVLTDTRTATCPYCGHHLSRRYFFKFTPILSCEGCAQLIKMRPANQTMLDIFAAPVAFCFLYIIFGLATGLWSVWPAVAVVILDFGLLVFLWPYGAEFKPTSPEVSLPKCPRCAYDLRASPDRCPECGLVIREELLISLKKQRST